MSYSTDEVMIGMKRVFQQNSVRFTAPNGWRIVDVNPVSHNLVCIVMVKA